MKKNDPAALEILIERFGKDTLISLATMGSSKRIRTSLFAGNGSPRMAPAKL